MAFWRRTLENLTGRPVSLSASRLDVHADFVGLKITEADRSAFACRSGRESVETADSALQTLYFGKRADIAVRIDDKLAEINAKVTGGYLLDLYGQSGLAAGEHVQRVRLRSGVAR